MKQLEWQFSTGIAGGIVFSLGITGKNRMVSKYATIYNNVYIRIPTRLHYPAPLVRVGNYIYTTILMTHIIVEIDSLP